MLLHVVRHGQTDWNVERRIQGQTDSQLDQLGVEQAKQRGKDFSTDQFTAVYCSSSVRTRQTTEHLLANLMGGQRADQLDSVVYMDDLREVCWGVWEGNLWSEIEAKYPEMVEANRKATDDFFVEGAESSYQTQARGIKAVEAIIKTQADAGQAGDSDEILVVSHGAIMRKIFAYYLDMPLTSLHTLPALPNCAHCIIEVTGQQRKVIQIAGIATEETEWAR